MSRADSLQMFADIANQPVAVLDEVWADNAGDAADVRLLLDALGLL